MNHNFVYSCDNIIKYWRTKEREKKLTQIKEFKTIFSDKTCTRNALTKYNFNTRNQKCFECNLLSSFFTKDIIETEESEIEIMAGEFRGDFLQIKINSSVDNKYQYCKYVNNIIEDKEITYYFTNDENLNRACINIIMLELMKIKNFNFYNNFLTYFICGQKIVNINLKYDYENIIKLAENDLFDTKKDITRDILICLIIFCDFFSIYHFCHNEPCFDFIKFNNGFNNFVYDQKEFYIPFLMTIEPSVYSSINYNQNRYFCKNLYDKKEWNSSPVESFDVDINGTKNYKKIELDIPYNKTYDQYRILFYKIGNKSKDFIYARRKLGLTFFHQSFDIICFIVSLLMEECFNHYFFSDYKLINLWKGLWRREDYSKLNEEISMKRIKKNKNDFDSVFSIVKKYYIRIDALKYLYNNLVKK